MRQNTLPEAARALVAKVRAGCVSGTEAAVALASLGVLHLQGGAVDPAREAFLLAARLKPLRAKTWLRLLSTLAPLPRR